MESEESKFAWIFLVPRRLLTKLLMAYFYPKLIAGVGLQVF